MIWIQLAQYRVIITTDSDFIKDEGFNDHRIFRLDKYIYP